MCDDKGGFRELDISRRKQINSYKIKSAVLFLVTHDNKFLVTAKDEYNCVLTKWSIRTKKQLYTWKSGVNE